jgi:hypothetical protein
VEKGDFGGGGLGEEVPGRLTWREGLALDEQDRKRSLSAGSDDLGVAKAVVSAADDSHGVVLSESPRVLNAPHGDAPP